MGKEKKKSYRDEHGVSRVGNFLRSIGKGNLLNKVIGTAGALITGNVSGAISSLLRDSNELTPEQRAYALELLASDVKENEEITKRWQSDMESDSWLAKNVRPIILLYLTLMMTVIAILDSALENFVVEEMWVTLLKTLMLAVYVAYFGGRSYEKSKKL